MPEAAFEARNLTKRFGRFAALKSVSLAVKDGEILTLFGRNGAGKTTFLHTAATLLRPTSGELFYRGLPSSADSSSARRQIGLVSHASFLYPDLSVRENLEFYAHLYGLDDVDAAVQTGMEQADLAARAASPVRSLSRGMHQRLTLARALLHRPSLLLLDEPFTGLDTVSAERFSELLSGQRTTGMATLLTTHDLERGLEVADRVAILESGRLVYQGEGRQAPAAFRKLFAEVTVRA